MYRPTLIGYYNNNKLLLRKLHQLIIMRFIAESVGYKRVCYYTNWSQYRPDPAKFFPNNIDPFLCTHMVFAFSKFEGKILATYEWNDILGTDDGL